MGVDTTIISQGANLLQGGPINAPGDGKKLEKKRKKKSFQLGRPSVRIHVSRCGSLLCSLI